MVFRRIYGFCRSNVNKYVDLSEIDNQRLKKNFLQAIPFWVASVCTGIIAIAFANVFAYAEKLFHYIFNHFQWYCLIISPACFLVAWFLVKHISPFSGGSGVPQVMASLDIANSKKNNRLKQLLGIRVIIAKIISSIFMALGGASIGREGPTIHIATSVFRKINSLLPHWWPKVPNKNMIIAGAGAGLAAAFNTPLGGIVFVVEELTRIHINYFKTSLFSAIIIAGLTAQTMLGNYLFLGFPNTDNQTGNFIYIPLLIISIVAGFLGGLMGKIIFRVSNWKPLLKNDTNKIIYMVSGAIIMVLLGIFISKNVFGSGIDEMNALLFSDRKDTDWYDPFLKMITSVFSFTTGGAGGIFAPSLSIGATLGSLVSSWFDLGNGEANILILAGMAAFLTGITRTPFTAAILVLEMTDRHNLIFQLMLACVIASFIALIVDRRSLYVRLKEKYLK